MGGSNHVGRINLGPQHFAQAIFQRCVEERVQGGTAEIAIDEQGATTSAGEACCQLAGDGCPPFHGGRARDEHHLTALNVGVSTTQRARAEQSYQAPVRLMEAVKLPHEALEAMEFMYERFGGDGVPGQRSGKEIPLGARVLAIADTYADLTHNPKNPFQKTLDAEEACSILSRYAPSLFDPNLVEDCSVPID